jgi:hypothetical protein
MSIDICTVFVYFSPDLSSLIFAITLFLRIGVQIVFSALKYLLQFLPINDCFIQLIYHLISRLAID